MASDHNQSWFHCGRCGSLFQSFLGESDERVCSLCGSDPALGLDASAANRAEFAEATTDVSNRRERSSPKKKKSNYLIAKLISAWVVILVGIIVVCRQLWPEEVEQAKPASSQTTAALDSVDEDRALLDEVGPQCNQAFAGYLAARTPEERNQFVLKPITTASRMNRFYAENPAFNINPQTLKITHSSVIHLPSGPAIETHWSSSDGFELDSVFMKENDEWRLDWDHFARYSDYPWPLFLAGSGEAFSEFRLLARERLAEERKNADSISIVLYSPRFGYPKETGSQSPEFLIPRATKNGRLLDAAFKLGRENKRVFGAQFPNINPEGFIRVRVKVRRSEKDLERSFELVEVLACHWYSVDAPGVEIPEPEPRK
jgi:hypothetical protein